MGKVNGLGFDPPPPPPTSTPYSTVDPLRGVTKAGHSHCFRGSEISQSRKTQQK